MKPEILAENYQKACHDYIREFEEKQDMCFDFWIADLIGEVAMFGDFSIEFRYIKFDIDKDIKAGKIIDYYDFILECHDLGDTIINYPTYLKLKL